MYSWTVRRKVSTWYPPTFMILGIFLQLFIPFSIHKFSFILLWLDDKTFLASFLNVVSDQCTPVLTRIEPLSRNILAGFNGRWVSYYFTQWRRSWSYLTSWSYNQFQDVEVDLTHILTWPFFAPYNASDIVVYVKIILFISLTHDPLFSTGTLAAYSRESNFNQ